MSCKVYISLEVTGLGEDLRDKHLAEPADVVTGQISFIKTLTAIDTEEEVNLDELDVVRGVMIKAIDFDLDIDLDYDGATFHKCLTLVAGEEATYIPYPVGDIFVYNETELTQYEVSAWGIASV